MYKRKKPVTFWCCSWTGTDKISSLHTVPLNRPNGSSFLFHLISLNQSISHPSSFFASPPSCGLSLSLSVVLFLFVCLSVSLSLLFLFVWKTLSEFSYLFKYVARFQVSSMFSTYYVQICFRLMKSGIVH